MKKYYSTILISILFLCASEQGFAQLKFPEITLKTGIIRNLQDEYVRDKPHYTFYPQIQVGARYEGVEIDVMSAFYWGFWDDGVASVTNSCRDCYTYSHSSHIVGAKLGVILNKSPIVPLGISVGLSRNFAHANYVGGFGVAGDRGKDFKENFNSIEIGAFIKIPFRDNIQFVGEFTRHIHIDEMSFFSRSTHKRRHSMSVGITYNM